MLYWHSSGYVQIAWRFVFSSNILAHLPQLGVNWKWWVSLPVQRSGRIVGALSLYLSLYLQHALMLHQRIMHEGKLPVRICTYMQHIQTSICGICARLMIRIGFISLLLPAAPFRTWRSFWLKCLSIWCVVCLCLCLLNERRGCSREFLCAIIISFIDFIECCVVAIPSRAIELKCRNLYTPKHGRRSITHFMRKSSNEFEKQTVAGPSVVSQTILLSNLNRTITNVLCPNCCVETVRKTLRKYGVALARMCCRLWIMSFQD